MPEPHIVIFALLLTAAVSFKADFPKARVTGTASNVVTASGFTARGLGNTPESAARAFVARYAADFGATAEQKLVPQGKPVKGKAGTVFRFERQLEGDPVLGAELVVTVNGASSVVEAHTVLVPAERSGSFSLTKERAIEAAQETQTDLPRESRPRAARAWTISGPKLKPVWQVDLVAGNPQSEWRSTIDAQDGSLLSRIDLHPNKPKPQKRDLAN